MMGLWQRWKNLRDGKKGKSKRKGVAREGKGRAQSSKPGSASSIRVVEDFIAAVNSHDIVTVKRMFSKDCSVIFVASEDEMSMSDYFDMLEAVMLSFPDFKFKTVSVSKKDVRNGSVDVHIGSIQASGTHTGTPFAFGPFPAIAAKSVYVKEPPLKVEYHIREGKICRFVLKNEPGKMSGPAFFYSAVGGIII